MRAEDINLTGKRIHVALNIREITEVDRWKERA